MLLKDKLHIALKNRLKVVYCIGEDKREKKNTKLKVQTAIHGDKLRVIGKNRNDLQTVIALVRSEDLGQPFQFDNFRD